MGRAPGLKYSSTLDAVQTFNTCCSQRVQKPTRYWYSIRLVIGTRKSIRALITSVHYACLCVPGTYQANRGKARVDWNHQHSSLPFCKLNARPTSVPFFIRETDPIVHPRRQRRPSCSDADPEDSKVGKKRAETRRSLRSIRCHFAYLSHPVLESSVAETQAKSTLQLGSLSGSEYSELYATGRFFAKDPSRSRD